MQARRLAQALQTAGATGLGFECGEVLPSARQDVRHLDSAARLWRVFKHASV